MLAGSSAASRSRSAESNQRTHRAAHQVPAPADVAKPPSLDLAAAPDHHVQPHHPGIRRDHRQARRSHVHTCSSHLQLACRNHARGSSSRGSHNHTSRVSVSLAFLLSDGHNERCQLPFALHPPQLPEPFNLRDLRRLCNHKQAVRISLTTTSSGRLRGLQYSLKAPHAAAAMSGSAWPRSDSHLTAAAARSGAVCCDTADICRRASVSACFSDALRPLSCTYSTASPAVCTHKQSVRKDLYTTRNG